VVAITTVFRLIAQGFMPADSDNLFPKSAIARAGLIPVAFTLFGLFTYGLLAIVFILIQDRLPGTRMKKGLMFGLLFGGMWIVYLLEPLPHVEGSPLIDVLVYPAADGITLVLEGLLMGRFIAADSREYGTLLISSNIVIIASVPIVFLAGRLLCYNVFHIYSSYATRSFATIIWAAATGIWIGIMYYFLRLGISEKSLLAKALYFGLIIFGIDYIMFNLFMPLVFEYQIWPIGAFLSYTDLFLRAANDIIFVTIGIYIYEKIISVKTYAINSNQEYSA
jgi:hypothetical protein